MTERVGFEPVLAERCLRLLVFALLPRLLLSLLLIAAGKFDEVAKNKVLLLSRTLLGKW